MKTTSPGRFASALAALVALTALCAPAAAQVTIGAAWVRSTVPGQSTAGAYMRITSRDAAQLVGAESPVAATAELHEMKMDGNVMRMRAIPALNLPAGRAVDLDSGGYHLMLTGLRHPLKKGDTVPIRLRIQARDKSFRTVEVRAEVRDTPPAMETHDGAIKMH